jgi:tetratricopeptide (TPR) repeat protein
VQKTVLRRFFGVPAFLLTLALFVLSGCWSQKGLNTSSVDKQYQRMLEEQKLKAAASEDPVPSEKIPENDPEIFERMGDAYLKQGNIDMAFIQYGKALRIDPSRANTRQKVGYLYLKKGLAAEALNDFNIILIKDPRNILVLQGKASALVQLNRLQEAEKILQEVISIESKSWQAYTLLGNIYDRQKRYEDAATAYRKAIEINPKSASVYNNLGISLFFMGKYRESVDALLSSISLDPSNLQSYNNLGLSLFKLGKYPEALETFKKGGDEASAYNNMGVLYMEEKNYAKAVEFFEKAIEAKSTYYESAHAGLQKAKAAMKGQKITQ